eukprot:CCRYP_005425-RA/>CCRYP_005425-RA protein AED:0.41 eAED:0.49 QI:0/0/0/1/0/0/2/0/261
MMVSMFLLQLQLLGFSYLLLLLLLNLFQASGQDSVSVTKNSRASKAKKTNSHVLVTESKVGKINDYVKGKSKLAAKGGKGSCNYKNEKECGRFVDCAWVMNSCVTMPPPCESFLSQTSCEINSSITTCMWKDNTCKFVEFSTESPSEPPVPVPLPATYPPSPWPTYYPIVAISELPTEAQVGLELDLIVGIRTPDCPRLLGQASTPRPSPHPIPLDTLEPTASHILKPTPCPSNRPINLPTIRPTSKPTVKPTARPTARPT